MAVGKNSQIGECNNRAVNEASSVVVMPSNIAEAADKLAIEDLRTEIATLRREMRLLRIANAELERVAILDTLTPLFNRRHFLSALNKQLIRAQRYNTKSAVLFVDINRMKHINDEYGHSAGDFALVHAAQIILAHIRKTDVAARIGGDEFAIMLEEVDQTHAAAKAEQLDEVLRSTPCHLGDDILPLSASIGYTMLMPSDSEDTLIERADASMYARKRAFHSQFANSVVAASQDIRAA
jgi:diguanylate cyclase (GGDEF)-like protein